MTGEYQHSIDTKGRLFIPASLREELGDTIYVTISIERALAAYSEETWREKMCIRDSMWAKQKN